MCVSVQCAVMLHVPIMHFPIIIQVRQLQGHCSGCDSSVIKSVIVRRLQGHCLDGHIYISIYFTHLSARQFHELWLLVPFVLVLVYFEVDSNSSLIDTQY